jgi:homoserine O-acetyltransferase
MLFPGVEKDPVSEQLGVFLPTCARRGRTSKYLEHERTKPVKQAIRSIAFLFFVLMLSGAAYGLEALRIADLGDLLLENGKVMKECRLGYRILGDMKKDGSNAVLFPTWFRGTTQELMDIGIIGPGKAVDTSRFCVIAVDSLGNGVSASPSNSKAQPGQAFPEFSIRDMVNAEHLLLTRELGMSRVYAVAGISMGGIQTFQWMVSYPGFFEKAVSIMGTPLLASSDLLLFHAEIMAIETGRSCGDPTMGMKTVAAIQSVASYTQDYINAHANPDELSDYIAGIEKRVLRSNPDDWERQLKAIMGHDIYRGFGGSPERAAAAVRAKALVAFSPQDQLINQGPIRAFSKLIGAQVLELNSYCGHMAFKCEIEKLAAPIGEFLGK